MALQKTLTTKGVDANYWSIMAYSADKPTNSTHVTLRLYIDQNVRTDNMDYFLESIMINLPGYELTLDEIYTLVKSANTQYDTYTEDEEPERVPFFSDAIDV